MYAEIVVALAPSAKLSKLKVTGAAIAVAPIPKISAKTLIKTMAFFISFLLLYILWGYLPLVFSQYVLHSI
jgi:hypothetical protein